MLDDSGFSSVNDWSSI